MIITEQSRYNMGIIVLLSDILYSNGLKLWRVHMQCLPGAYAAASVNSSSIVHWYLLLKDDVFVEECDKLQSFVHGFPANPIKIGSRTRG